VTMLRVGLIDDNSRSVIGYGEGFGQDSTRTTLTSRVHRKLSKTLNSAPSFKMATKYAFSQSLKELRFHLCQTSDGSAALRYVRPRYEEL